MFSSQFWYVFDPHLRSWPYHDDVSATFAAKEDAIRRERGDTFTSSWRDRQDTLHPAQSTVFNLAVPQEQSTHQPAQSPDHQGSPFGSDSLFSFSTMHTTPVHPSPIASIFNTSSQHTTPEHQQPNTLNFF
jgi:hypothetical protein